MAEVVYDGVGTPVIDPQISGAESQLGAPNAIFNNDTSPTEATFDGVGVPVADGNSAENPQNFDNKGKNVTLGAAAAIFDNDTSPTEQFFDGIGIPVGDGNAANNPVTFDNKGKNVTVAPDAGPPVGNAVERKFFSPPLNFNP